MATLEEIRNLAEPLKGYQFQITISNPAGQGASIELMQFRCTSAAIPGNVIDEVLVELGNGTPPVRYAGKSRPVGTWTTTFIEGTDLAVVQRVRTWQEVCNSQATGIQGEAADYKRTATIELLNNAKEVVQSHRIVGLWPQDVPDTLMDTASSEATRYDVTWAYDYHEII